MPKYFLYIDESKDYKNHTLYLGGLISKIGLGGIEKFCTGCCVQKGSAELKSTKDYDRHFFEEIITQENIPFEVFVQKITSHSDEEYLDNIIDLMRSFYNSYEKIDAIDIFADFTRLSPDTHKTEAAFSRKLTNLFGIPIAFSFKNSKLYRSIQFADLAVGSYKKQKKGSAFDVSQSESKTSLHITARNL